ncbi:hypothetical protein Pmar_PMAR011333 [Perkinsus marinus ATCC 50983]|uniref:Uncharacterized protein n=1 Tax=Perkinsus marinus (strain ATCC 50983 / TXsc) TaxID=423536 RepID=C5L479_PERM5|nr:hypothetical protein Pmar_PMAR011333 [Perkinsus marinus ATCC 50983]EER08464.1 hypothetical protein Pmar_PMAR011333 [Perkinsus marinus ATCC 50983]|eukprot:XP_002776648.1 hypothetical protein Pmar_PMAR011333 [Perkinsus marinus ATCC 50983]
MDVRTRWNSTYAMLKDFYANREWYKKFLKDAPKHVKPNSPIYTTCKSCKLKDTEYGLILAICNTLEPLNDATKLLSASNFSTLTQLHEVISMLKLFLRSSETKSTYVKRLQGNLLFQLEKYFEYITTDDFILAAAYLNADTRRSTYSEELKVDNGIGRSSVIQCIKRLKISSKFVSLPVAKPNRQSCKGEKKSTSAFFDFMNNQICSDLASESMADGEGANLEPGDVDEERLQSLLSEYERRARTYPTPQEHDSQPIPDVIYFVYNFDGGPSNIGEQRKLLFRRRGTVQGKAESPNSE